MARGQVTGQPGHGALGAVLGAVAAIKMVSEEDDLLVITNDGTIIRTPVERISRLGRATQGVRVMRLLEGSRVIDIEKTLPERDEEASEDGEE